MSLQISIKINTLVVYLHIMEVQTTTLDPYKSLMTAIYDKQNASSSQLRKLLLRNIDKAQRTDLNGLDFLHHAILAGNVNAGEWFYAC